MSMNNKAPEKIYLYPGDRAGEEYEDEWGDKPWGEDCVEYTRKDAFIEKACEWLKNNLEKYYYLDEAYDKVISIKNLNNDFKNYMKGE